MAYRHNDINAASELAALSLIRPSTTCGHLGDVVGDKLIYDAPTAHGGSGGPVFNTKGEVIGVNSAYMDGFYRRHSRRLGRFSPPPPARSPESPLELNSLPLENTAELARHSGRDRPLSLIEMHSCRAGRPRQSTRARNGHENKRELD